MRNQGWQIAFAVALAAAAMTGVAAAQQTVHSPAEIQGCLCQEQSVAALNGEMQRESRAYEDKRQSFQALDDQVRTSRSQVNVNNPGDVEAFKRLLDRRDQAADELAGNANRSYSAAVARYNQAVSGYNTSCAGKAFDADQMAEVKRSLSCPKP